MRAILVVLLASSLVFPLASAEAPSCSDVTDDGALGAGGLYLGSDGGLWRERNTMPGLQTEDCTDENGRDAIRDEKLL
ncbi:MAG TPA: hypothetical protein VI997_00645 [Candidatus Thermoplasmatota archaeon]|nr:hypothetical protein [Candidatus Thermoplasmatota archaeon]